MIGLPEILILAVIVLLIVGYKKLPEIGRATGGTLRSGVDKARGLSSRAGEKVQDKVDPEAIGRSAGSSLREVREVRDAFTGKDTKKDDASGKG